MNAYRILLVDDDPLILAGIGKDLEGQGYGVVTAESGEKALALIAETPFDLVLTDQTMDKVDGLMVLKAAKNANPENMVILLTGCGDIACAIDALRLNADDYLLKPCAPEEIRIRVKKCLQHLEASRKLKLYEKVLPICCVCKKIRDEDGKAKGTGQWMSVEKYVWEKAGLKPTSTYCPDCAAKARKEMDTLRGAHP
jgi:DNA-binding response OmpR family regulator